MDSAAVSSLRYFDYVNFNNTGFRPYDVTLWAVMVGSARKCISRMLLLVVAMGYGVVRPTLGGLTKKVRVTEWPLGTYPSDGLFAF